MLLLSSASLTIASLLKEMDSLNEKLTIIQIIAYGAIATATSFVIAMCILIYRIIFPTILKFPWSMPPENSTSRKKEKEMTVVFAGSFNPPHWGHLVMLKYLAERYGRVICCIGVNPNKVYDVTPKTRAEILRGCFVV